jgi:hypothetical protein
MTRGFFDPRLPGEQHPPCCQVEINIVASSEEIAIAQERDKKVRFGIETARLG